MLALLLAAGALVGIVAPAQAAPGSAPTFTLTQVAGGRTFDFTPNLEPGSEIVELDVPAGASAGFTGPNRVTIAAAQTPGFPNYLSSATIGYTVERDGERADGQIDVTFVHKPWVYILNSNETPVSPGAMVTSRVEARGWGFTNGVEDGGHYSVKAQPSVGTASVAPDGTVTYTAPANAVPNTPVEIVFVATDGFGQQSETFQPMRFRIAGTAEADIFSVDIPYGDGSTATRVDILPDHARGVNPRLLGVSANITNAAVSFDSTGATFTPPPRSWAEQDTAYSFIAPYLIVDDNGPATAHISVRVLRPPQLTGPTHVQTVPIGGSATSTVKVLNDRVIPAGGYTIAVPPSVGTATVDDRGVVTYTAPADMESGAVDGPSVQVTDVVGQSQTIDVRFEAYEGAVAPDIEEQRADDAFTLNLLEGARGEGKTLTHATLVSGDAELSADLAAGTLAVTPNHAWAAGEATHELVLSYTIEDVLGRTATGTATITVLARPTFALADPGDLSKTAELGDTVRFSVQVLAPENLPQTGAFTVTQQPTLLAATLARASGPVTVSDAGLVTVATSTLAANRSYEFSVRVEDRVGQSAVQTFRLALVPASVDADADPNGGPDEDSQGAAQGDPNGDPQGGSQGGPDGDPSGGPGSDAQGDADSDPESGEDASTDAQGGAAADAEGEAAAGPQGEAAADPQGDAEAGPQADADSSAGAGADGADANPAAEGAGTAGGGATSGGAGTTSGGAGATGANAASSDASASAAAQGGADGRGSLAATGSRAVPWLGLAAAAALFGLALTARRHGIAARRSSSPQH